jgi:hypothetical protein
MQAIYSFVLQRNETRYRSVVVAGCILKGSDPVRAVGRGFPDNPDAGVRRGGEGCVT